jgi:imidazole glycerol phosphate synthase glutamine amidotransferase subunit
VSSVVLLDYGGGNVRSVAKAFEHQGVRVTLSADPGVARRAERLALPGQGHFGQCMNRLRERGLDEAVLEFVATGRPFIGICVGMQLLFEASEEAPGVAGLGLIPGEVRRLRTDLPLPHVGWNSVEWIRDAGLDPVLDGVAGPDPRWFYHVHSFAALEADAAHVLGRCTYDDAFASVVRRDNAWGIQVHPEKSQEDGLRILANFARLP